MPDSPRISLVAGGTGGHVMPAVCIGEYLRKQKIAFECLSDERAMKYWPKNWTTTVVRAGNIRTRSPLILCKNMYDLLKGFFSSRAHFRAHRPKLVVGFGAYPTLMPLLAARSLGIPIAIFELDNRIGFANKILKSLTTLRLSAHQLGDNAFIHVGLPVRAPIEDIGKTPYTPPRDSQPFVLTIIGGSQGAHIFSRVLPDALARLDSHGLTRLHIIHQAPENDIETLRKKYTAIGVSAEVHPFISDMKTTLKKTHLLISRCGASTLGEIIASVRPAILVPFAKAADNHQLSNAQAIADANAAIVIEEYDLNATTLGNKINNIIQNTEILLEYSNNLRSLRSVGAARRFVDHIRSIIKG